MRRRRWWSAPAGRGIRGLLITTLVGVAVLGVAAVGCTAGPAEEHPAPSPGPVAYQPGEPYGDPRQRFALRLPVGWTNDASYWLPASQDSRDWHSTGPVAPAARFYNEAAPADPPPAPNPPPADLLRFDSPPLVPQRSPILDITVRKWSRDLETAVADYRKELSAAYPPLADRPVTLADGTPAQFFDGPHVGGGAIAREVRLLAVSGGWLFDAQVSENGVDLAAYGTEFFEATLRTMVVAGDPPPGRWPWPATPYTDPAGRFALLLPAGFTFHDRHPTPENEFYDEYPVHDVRFLDPQSRTNGDRSRDVTIEVVTYRNTSDLAESAASDRQERAEQGAQLQIDQPLVLSDGTPAHLIGGLRPAYGTYQQGADEPTYDRMVWTLHAVRDGALVTVTIDCDPVLLADYPADMVDATLRSLRIPA